MFPSSISGPVTDDSLNYKGVLKVTDTVAPLHLALVNSSVRVAASQAIGLFAIAESVDEGPQLPHVPHPACHHHLLLNDVRMRQVRPSLDINEEFPQISRRHN